MNRHEVDKKTGFLQSVNPTACFASAPLDADKKVQLLNLATAAIDRGEAPSLNKICDALGVNQRSVYKHLKLDRAFADAWKEVKLRWSDGLTGELQTKAMSKQGTLANLAMLRWLETGSWTGQYVSNPQSDQAATKTIIQQYNSVIDAEIVENDDNKPKMIDNQSKSDKDQSAI